MNIIALLLLNRARSLKNLMRRFYAHDPVRFLATAVFMLASLLCVWGALFKGFSFLVSLGSMGSIIIKRLFYIPFFIIFLMVAVSFGVLYYTCSFRSKETEYLLTMPIDTRYIAFFKFIEAAVLAGWIPYLGLLIFIITYVQINNLSPLIVPAASVFLIPYLAVSCAAGYAGAVVTLRFIRFKWLFMGLLILLTGYFFYRGAPRPSSSDFLYFFSEEVMFFRTAHAWFAPFAWVPWGILNLEDQNIMKSALYLFNIFSLCIFCLYVLFVSSGTPFREIYFIHSRPSHGRFYHKGILDTLFSKNPLPRRLSQFLLKDIKLFIREPAVWLQFLIFFGLLFFYFINLRRFSYHLLADIWKNLLVFLNTFSILCIAAALTVRFIFPQWSLEGRNYWILKLSPTPLRLIYSVKLLFSWILITAVSVLLLYTSNHMLKVSTGISCLTLILVGVASTTLVSFALGLGAYFADFKTTYYLNAVESLGGLIALVLNFTYVVATVFIFTLIRHLSIKETILNGRTFLVASLLLWSFASTAAAIIITRWGFKKLKTKEY